MIDENKSNDIEILDDNDDDDYDENDDFAYVHQMIAK